MEARYLSWGEHRTSTAFVKDLFAPKTYRFISAGKRCMMPPCPSGIHEHSPAALSFRIAHLEVPAYSMNAHMTNQPLWMKQATADRQHKNGRPYTLNCTEGLLLHKPTITLLTLRVGEEWVKEFLDLYVLWKYTLPRFESGKLVYTIIKRNLAISGNVLHGCHGAYLNGKITS